MTATPPPATPMVAWEGPEQVEGPAPGIEYAPHGARLVAYILDGLIITAVCLVLAIVGGSSSSRPERPSPTTRSPSSNPLTTTVFDPADPRRDRWSLSCTSRSSGRAAARRRGCGRSACASYAIGDGGSIGWGTALLRLLGLWVAGACCTSATSGSSSTSAGAAGKT